MTSTNVAIEAVVDESGSMGAIREDAIGGYNTWLKGQQDLPGEATLTLTLFDHEHKVFPTVAIKDAKPLDRETYVPRGSTALNDAMGRALNRLFAANPEKAILVVCTDGHENASTEFTLPQVKELVEKAQARGWQVVYLSADLAAFDHAAAFGVLRGSTVQFDKSAEGITRAYAASTTLNASYRTGVTLDATPENKP